MKHSTLSKHPRLGYVPVCYEVINPFIKSQNFLLMGFICKLKGLYLIVTACDGLLMFFLDLFDSCIKSTSYDVFQDVFLRRLVLVSSRVNSDIKSTSQQNENMMVLRILPGCHIMTPPFQPSGRPEFSDLRLPALPLTWRCELPLKISPHVPS